MALDAYVFSADDHSLGGGVVSIAEWTGSTAPSAGDYVDMGNVSEFSTQPEVTKLELNSHRGGTKKIIKKVAMETKLTGNLRLLTINENAMKIFFMASLSGTTIRPGMSTSMEYGLKFVPDYESGNEYNYELYKVEMSPADALNVIDQEAWHNMGFTFEVLADETNHPDDPYGRIYPKPTT